MRLRNSNSVCTEIWIEAAVSFSSQFVLTIENPMLKIREIVSAFSAF